VVRFFTPLALVLLWSGLSLASPEICRTLPQLSKGSVSSSTVDRCYNRVEGQTFDFVAMMICRDLNRISKAGATGEDITHCLQQIGDQRYNYTRLRSCKSPHKDTRQVFDCIRKSSV
jgi:hypothetical protein